MQWYLHVLKNYAVFKGRASRKEFWMFVLFNIIVSVILSILEGLVSRDTSILSGLYSLAVLVPSLAVTVRRLHDTNKSGWWWFIVLVPIIGPFVLLAFMIMDSQAAANQYGEPVKGKSPEELMKK